MVPKQVPLFKKEQLTLLHCAKKKNQNLLEKQSQE
jgi:hypothetical protein